ncbi:pre-mRNA-processing factor 17 [Maniola hyperantus]|uniref:pre-mRNA-processing factor 17 n=1 Tax=Aphantopus hyperantus TaxID=2795564 RepID=UPI001568F96E|nr:pre-mRNA-processing factor 17 isoform X1 [Maniola hyperantus]XP_034829963.1 pre-mRNA-processing factor 17 isoform X2 [Maniola hyperantus]
MLNIKNYGSSSEDDSDIEEANMQKGQSNETLLKHLKPVDPSISLAKKMEICAAPLVTPTNNEDSRVLVSNNQELMHNPKYEELFAPTYGPENPFQTQQMKATRNMLAGYVEKAHISEFQFENQRRTFTSYGYAIDPSTEPIVDEKGDAIVVSAMIAPPAEAEGKTVFESIKKRPLDKKKRNRNDNPEDVTGFLGPWGGYEGERRVMKPEGDEAKELEEILAKRQKKGKVDDDKPLEEKSILHIDKATDYLDRSWIEAPRSETQLRRDTPPDKCFLPKAHIFTWKGHTKGVAAVRWYPGPAHLMLSAGMDCRVKIWEVYGSRRCVRTYFGHRQAVRDVNFNNCGKHFLSAAYDRYIKLWDTETGQCMSRFTSRKVPYCAKFNPDEDKQHLFVAGTSDKKIICWDIRSGEIVQEYDRHLGAVNTITFVDDNRRFVSTSDDKSLRVWEWDIPVDMKYIADPSMHSLPAVTAAPNGKWLACQSMDNKVVVFSALNRFKLNRKKTFAGHMVAGYACAVDFSPDMSYLVSGDADGKCYIWDWKTTKLYKKWKAHDGVCITSLWHPHEPSRLLTAGWDGVIKYWD